MADTISYMVEVFQNGDSKGFWDERMTRVAPHAGQNLIIGDSGQFFSGNAIATVFSDPSKASSVSHKLTATLQKAGGPASGWVAAVRKVRVL
jgi:hypothetical protein